MGRYQENMPMGKEGLEIARDNLLEAYFSEIRESYKSSNLDQKSIIGSLEYLVCRLKSKKESRKNNSFDYLEARRVRENAGLSQGELAKKLEFTGAGNIKISLYERGVKTPSNPPQSEKARKYLEWLKEQGYNPYNL